VLANPSARDNGCMLRALILTTVLLVVPGAVFGQTLSILHINVVLLDAEQRRTPVPHHALLISDNPPTTAPRRIITAMDGTADVRLRPGTYTVESDRPVALERKSYQWTQTVDIVAGRDGVLELTTSNADIEPVGSTGSSTAAALETDPSVLVSAWLDSVIALWTPLARSSGFLVDARGLIATSQRSIGNATTIEVQLAAAVKVPGRVLVADSARDIAVIWVDPKAVASLRSVPMRCAPTERSPLVDGQAVLTIGVPFREPKGLISGNVSRVDSGITMSDFILANGSVGGPVFAANGALTGLTSGVNEENGRLQEQVRVVSLDDLCSVFASAETKTKDSAPPSGVHLPLEPLRPFPADTLKEEAKRRSGSSGAYVMSASDFDVAFLTPVMIYAAQQKPEESRARGGSGSVLDAKQPSLRALSDFANWSSYVADVPPVLLVRVTPRLVEGFWTTVARGAAYTQGVSLPAMKHFKPGFSRMRLSCGGAEVAPIHPFRLEQRVSEADQSLAEVRTRGGGTEAEAIYEGLYVFDPAAIGPHCASVTLVLYSEKQPEKGETRVVDPKVVQQVWQDFAPYRDLR
ncbi:MAG: serine protease, partial [Vicinamibacterales bacterium]